MKLLTIALLLLNTIDLSEAIGLHRNHRSSLVESKTGGSGVEGAAVKPKDEEAKPKEAKKEDSAKKEAEEAKKGAEEAKKDEGKEKKEEQKVPPATDFDKEFLKLSNKLRTDPKSFIPDLEKIANEYKWKTRYA